MAPICIQLHKITGTKLNIHIEEDGATIQTIKEAVEDKYCVQVARQCLIFRGETLMNKTLIKTKRIRNNSKLYLVLAPRCSCYDPKHWKWGLNPRPVDWRTIRDPHLNHVKT